MPDIRLPDPGPLDIGEALSRLPLEAPERSAWPALAERLAVRAAPPSRLRWPFALTAAAVLVLAVALPRLQSPDAPPAEAGNASLVQADPDLELQRLMAESTRLEHLLAAMRDDRAGAAVGLLLGLDFEDRLLALDEALAQPDLEAGQRRRLWQQRVELLRGYAGLQGTRQWLAAEGSRLDGDVVAVF